VEKYPHWVIRPQVPDEVFTDRAEFLEYFYKSALETANRRTMSTVLLGQRRMGKTEIFIRVINRLFWEQDHLDPQAVVPVYYKFEDKATDELTFAIRYVENFIRWYGAFRLRDPNVLSKDYVSQDNLAEFITSKVKLPERAARTFNLLRFFKENKVTLPDQAAVSQLREVSDWDDSSIVVFLDEFQNARLPQYNFDVVGYYQFAVESNTCPHFVTGSAMSILAKEILGRGSLFGRFSSEPIEPLTTYWGAELALKVAHYYQAQVSEEMAPVLAERCNGNPFYITAVVRQTAKRREVLNSEDTLNKILAVDLSSGFIWAELHDQVTRWIERVNEYGITKWVLYLSALGDEEEIHPERIQSELWERDRMKVSIEKVREVLIKLSRGDLLDYKEFGNWFAKIDDPILLEFLRVWGKIEVERRNRGGVEYELYGRYQQLKRQISEYKGYLAEVFMSQVLWSGQNKTLVGRLFHCPVEIKMPWRFIFINYRARLGSGEGQEIDVLAAASDSEVWVCQSKWQVNSKVGVNVLEMLLAQGEVVKQVMTPFTLRLWLFAYSGLTAEAEQMATERGILWSTLAELNELLVQLGLRQLPQL